MPRILRYGVIVIGKRLPFLVFIFILAGVNVISVRGEVYKDVPQEVFPDRKYLFYMHGAWIEKHGLDSSHPKHGYYEYTKIVQALSDRGFVVISEPRLDEVSILGYAEKIVEDADYLLDKGVYPEDITIAGHSKGGFMSLLAASMLREARMNFVIMAGCGLEGAMFRRGYKRFLEKRARLLKGRILSIYDEADCEAGTCSEAFEQAEELVTEEVAFKTGRGHGLFYLPEDIWVEEIARWAGVR